MASIYWRGRAAWLKWYEGGVMLRESLGVVPPEQAEEQRQSLEAALARGDRFRVPGSMPFEEAFVRFVRDKEEKREPATAKTYAKHGRQLASHGFPTGKRLGQITSEDVERYLARRVKAGLSHRTANKERGTLAIFWRWAIKKQLARDNPVLAVDPYSARPNPPEACPESIYRAALKGLRAEAAQDHTPRTILADSLELCWEMGLRIGEVAALRPEHVDLQARVMVVASAANKGPALVPIPEEVVGLLERHLERGCEYVIASSRGGHVGRANEQAWARWLAAHPKHAPAHAHALRHAFQARLEAEQVDPGHIQRLMRHATLQMHAHYSHRTVEQLRAARSALSRRERGDDS